MARELPIHNGRMTTDLDANGFKIKNLPPGSGFTQAQADWNQEDATAPDFIKNKPTIPAAVTVDATLTHQGAAAEAEAVGDALAVKLDGVVAYPEWDGTVSYGAYECVWYNGRAWVAAGDISSGLPPGEDPLWVRHSGNLYSMILEKQDALSSAQLAAVNSGATAAKVATWDGYAAQIAAKASTVDVNAALAQKANLSDLPYRLVEPGKWEFSDGLSHEISGPREVSDPGGAILGWIYQSSYNGVTYFSQHFETEALALATLELTFSSSGDSFTATRASLPGHLLDRAGNRVVVSGDTTLTLPAAVPGYLRDFLVRLEISGSTVPTITFSPDGNESVIYETDGDEFPVPDEAGTWLYSFTESCVAHKFAVALKKVTPVAQGGA